MANKKQSTKSCPYCGKKILISAKKCKYCGEWLRNTSFNILTSDTIIQQAFAQKYQIIEKIGQGGMAVVYKAIQIGLNRPVALKILHQHFADDNEFLLRFHREAQAAAKINHPNIVTIYEEGVENGIHYIAMEYINGSDLYTIIQQNKIIPLTQIKEWLIPIIEGLDYAHRQRLIHRDIKSANILIDDKNRAILTDFGIVCSNDNSHLTQTGTILGTPEYMSPEQARGGRVDKRSDIYSLGVVLYECLTGSVPFKSPTILDTIHKIVYESPTPPRAIRKEIPIEIENAVLRCLAKDPSKRYQSCKDLSTALKQGELNQTLFKKRNKLFSKKNQTKLLSKFGIIAIIIALFILLGIFLNQNNELFIDTNTKSSNIKTKQFVPKNNGKQYVLTLLNEANRFFVNGQILSPPRKNAFELYQKVLKIQPNNKQALSQMELIRKDLLRRSYDAFNKGKYKIVLHITTIGLSYFNKDAKLLHLKKMSKIKILENKAFQLLKNKNFINPKNRNAYFVSQEILKLDKQNKIANEILKEIKNWFAICGTRAITKKEWEKAISIYSDAIKYFGPNKLFLEQLTLAQDANVKKEEMLDTETKDMLSQAKNLIDQEQYTLAWQLYDKILKLYPQNEIAQYEKQKIIATLEHKAQLAFNLKDFSKSQKLYKLLNTLHPNIDYVKKENISAEHQKWLKLIDWVWIKGGSFKMGCNEKQNDCENDEKPIHKVILNGFYLSKYEITIAQFAKFIKDTNYKTFPERNGYSWIWDGEWYKVNGMNWKLDAKGNRRPQRDYDYPVIHVSWEDAMAFCKWLSQKTDAVIRLPTEAEWEYAAKGGAFSSNNTNYTKYAGSNNVGKVAWYFGNSQSHTHPVGQKFPNDLDLYDMSGNVWEWCLDCYDKNYYAHSPINNPKKLTMGKFKVVRGGSWDTDINYLRITNRFYANPTFSSNDLGFRVVRIR